MTTNIERAAEVLRGDKHYKMGPHGEQFLTSEAARSLADAGLLLPDLPEPKEKGGWIPFEENQDEYFDIWVSGPGFLKVDGSRRWRKQLTPESARIIAFALLAAANHAEQERA